MSTTEITERDRQLAAQCGKCPMCRRARKQQRGVAYLFVRFLERGICPACKAYEKVYGKQAHER
jgi:hypothetical protein